MSNVDNNLQQLFHDAFGRVAAPVGIVGVCDEEGNVHGMTATAISSLSNDPPSLVALVNNENQTSRTILERGQFCISYLKFESEAIALRLSRPGQSKTLEAHELVQPEGWPVPVLRNASVTMMCELETALPQYTHQILVGRITHVHIGDGPADPLLYLQRAFHRLAA
jgi:flavin reductase